MSIPKSFTTSSHLISLLSMLSSVKISWDYLPTDKAWNLSGFACILYTLNHSISIFESDSKVEINKSKSGVQKDKVLSSA